MGAFDRFLQALHRVFDKDPQKVAIVSIAFEGDPRLVTVSGLQLVIRTPGADSAVLFSTFAEGDVPFADGIDFPFAEMEQTVVSSGTGGITAVLDLSSATVAQMVDSLNAVPECTATLLRPEFGDHLARGLFEVKGQEIGLDPYLYYPTSPLWSELRTLGWIFDEQTQRRTLAENQMYLNRASGEWLRHWGEDRFGVSRYRGENDTDYAKRIVNEVIRPNQNNVALELILQEALGVAATIRDAYPLRGDLPLEDQDKTPGHFFLEMQVPNELSSSDAEALISRCKELVRRYKAAGTDFFETVLRQLVSQVENMATVEELAAVLTATMEDSFQAGYIRVGAGWRVGTPGLKVGVNDPLKEQARVRLIAPDDVTVLQSNLYGG